MAPLHDAARSGNAAEVERILDSRPHVIDNPGPGSGWTALHSAVVRGRTDVVRLLVDRGANVDKANLNHLTPLFSAVSQHRQYDIVRALVVDGGANVLVLGHNGQTAFEYAKQNNCSEEILQLLQTHTEQAQAERTARKEAEKNRRAEAAAKRKAEREAGGGARKKGKRGKVVAEEHKEEHAPTMENNPEEVAEPDHPEEENKSSNTADSKPAAAVDAPVPNYEPDDNTPGKKGDSGEPTTQVDGEEIETVLFLEEENREVIYARELFWVEGTTLVRKEAFTKPQKEEDRAIEDEDTDSVAVVQQAAAKLTKQLETWLPDQSAVAFFVPPSEVEAGRRAVDEAATTTTATPPTNQKPFAGACLAHGLMGVTDDGHKLEVRIAALAHSRKTAWTNRYYYSGGRIHAKTLAKVKAATNALKAQVVKGSLTEVKFYTEARAWYWPPVLLVGECKKVPGALFGVKYECIDQEHLHHGR